MRQCTMFFSCVQQRLERTDGAVIAADSVRKLCACFGLCDSWEGLRVYARFDREGLGPFDVELSDGCAMVPHEVLSSVGNFDVALFGENAEGVRLTSTRVTVPVVRSVGYDENPPIPYEPEPPTPSLLEQIQQVADDAAASAERSAAAAESAAGAAAATVEIGEVVEGDEASVWNSGDEHNAVLNFTLRRGDKGDTPVRGVDYWTADDVAEIKGYVDSAILGGAW